MLVSEFEEGDIRPWLPKYLQKDFISFVQQRGLLCGSFVQADVRVGMANEAQIGFPDLCFGAFSPHAQNLLGSLLFHSLCQDSSALTCQDSIRNLK